MDVRKMRNAALGKRVVAALCGDKIGSTEKGT